jgi:hypothetical protein
MWVLAAIIGMAFFLTLSAAGAFIESINPDELLRMGVVRHS